MDITKKPEMLTILDTHTYVKYTMMNYMSNTL